MKNYFSASGVCRILFAALTFASTALPLTAQESFFSGLSWFAQGSIMFFLEDNGLEGDPMPVLPSIGVGVSLPLRAALRLEVTMDVYSTHYGFSDTLDRPVPLADENRTARVTGILLGFQAVRPFNITPNMTLRANGGLAADLRIITIAARLHEDLNPMRDIDRQTSLVRDYFWSQGRWLLPVIGAGADYMLNSGLRLGLDFRVWMPAYRLWTGENLPTVEGWRLGTGIRLTAP